jgi:hypothetical protein
MVFSLAARNVFSSASALPSRIRVTGSRRRNCRSCSNDFIAPILRAAAPPVAPVWASRLRGRSSLPMAARLQPKATVLVVAAASFIVTLPLSRG